MRVRVLQQVPFEGPGRIAEWAAARGPWRRARRARTRPSWPRAGSWASSSTSRPRPRARALADHCPKDLAPGRYVQTREALLADPARFERLWPRLDALLDQLLE